MCVFWNLSDKPEAHVQLCYTKWLYTIDIGDKNSPKEASEGNQHGIEKIIKACEFSHQYVKKCSEMATNAVSDISTAGAGPSQRGRCTHAVWKKDLWLTCHKETRNWCINMNTERDILVKKKKKRLQYSLELQKNNSITSNPTLQYF